MTYELIGSHVLDAVCDNIDELEKYIHITTDDADDRRHIKSELESIRRLIKFGRVACDVQPMPK